RPEPSLGALRRHVEENGVRLPEHEFAVLESRHLPVGIEGEIFGSELVATTKINRFQLTIESKMVLECDDAEHARGWGKEIELHSGSLGRSSGSRGLSSRIGYGSVLKMMWPRDIHRWSSRSFRPSARPAHRSHLAAASAAAKELIAAIGFEPR